MFHSLLFPRARAHVQSNSQADIYDAGDHYLLQINAVGFSKQDIALSATNNTIKIEGSKERNIPEGYTSLHNNHRKEQRIQRSFRFRDSLDTDAIEAHIEHGLLHVKIPKRSARKIDIQVL